MAGKKPTKTSQKIKLDTIFSKLVRAVGRCERCSATSGLQCAHIVSRRYLCTRWDPANALALCAKCHMYMTYRPLEWERWITEKIGEQPYEKLKKKALGICKLDYATVLRSLEIAK